MWEWVDLFCCFQGPEGPAGPQGGPGEPGQRGVPGKSVSVTLDFNNYRAGCR